MKLKYISWIPALIIMGVIFYFSSRPDTDSNESSLAITNTIIKVYESTIGQPLQEEDHINMENIINHIVRKGAHFTEYAILAITIAFHLWVQMTRKRWLLILPIIIAGLYAAGDEFHQTFVPGRSGQITDVLLDTSGAAMGALLFVLVITVFFYNKGLRRELNHLSKPV